MAGSPRTFAAKQTLPDVPPAPVSATFFDTVNALHVVFDQVLRPGTIDPANWTIRVNNQTLTPILTRFFTPTTVLVVSTSVAGPPQADECDFSPPPNDIRNMRLVPAVPFANFPLVVVP